VTDRADPGYAFGMATDAEARTRAASLYASAPEDFIAGRNALADELRAAGEDDLAAAVKKLRKPSVVAWAVDVAARGNPEDVTALLRAGDELRRAQRAAISGGGQTELRAAAQARRGIIATLTDAATSALGPRAGPHRDAIASTFEAASVDPDLGSRLREGTLDKEAAPGTGLGVPEGFQLLEGGAAKGKDDRAAAAEREAEAKEAERAATSAERDAERAELRAEQLRAKARAAVEEAEAAETEASRLADEARTQRRRAHRARTRSPDR